MFGLLSLPAPIFLSLSFPLAALLQARLFTLPVVHVAVSNAFHPIVRLVLMDSALQVAIFKLLCKLEQPITWLLLAPPLLHTNWMCSFLLSMTSVLARFKSAACHTLLLSPAPFMLVLISLVLQSTIEISFTHSLPLSLMIR